MPEPGVDERRARRRWARGTVAVVVLVVAAVAVGVVIARPDEPTGYGPELERTFTGWCRRSGAEADDAGPGACRCAYDALAAAVPFERFHEVDEQLEDGDELPADLQSVVARCLGDG